jgi:flagellar hook-associated protein 1 FlgK
VAGLPNPAYAVAQTNVVTAGTTFATAATSQYSQLQNLQSGLNTQVGESVSTINNLLQQLGSINQQLLTSNSSNQNSLLDARDYALDLLSRQMNYQVAYGTDGTATVWLSGVQLVNGSNVTQLQEKAQNPNNPTLVDITTSTYSYLPSGAKPASAYDLTSSITGGDLGGELYARNVVLPSYMLQVDQIATSVLNMTNNLYEAGYVANGASTTTGTAFFTGTGAASIAVNAVLSNDAAGTGRWRR